MTPFPIFKFFFKSTLVRCFTDLRQCLVAYHAGRARQRGGAPGEFRNNGRRRTGGRAEFINRVRSGEHMLTSFGDSRNKKNERTKRAYTDARYCLPQERTGETGGS